jgi:hypothetical protein
MSMRSLLIFGGLATLAGCSASVDLPDAEAQTSTSASAVIVVERGPSGDAIVARFMRARQGNVDDLALRTAGVQDLPSVGTCITSLSFEGPMTARAVDLLDVGAVTWETSSQSTVLLPRSLPDPAGMVSGYFYSARTNDAVAAATTSRVSLRASGGADLPEGFAVSLALPHELADVSAASTANGVDVTWDATDADARDFVYVDVLAREGGTVARCSANDVGRLTLPASVLGSVEEPSASSSLSVHRVHREPFKARGIDPGEVRFDLARVVTFRR